MWILEFLPSDWLTGPLAHVSSLTLHALVFLEQIIWQPHPRHSLDRVPGCPTVFLPHSSHTPPSSLPRPVPGHPFFTSSASLVLIEMILEANK